MLNSTRWTAVFVASVAIAISLGAQTTECIAKLPPSVFTRVPVLIDTTPEDSAAVAILPAADILTQIVTEHVRKTLGSETGPLPQGDAVVTWQQLGGSVLVTAHHDGTFAWRKDTTVTVSFMGTQGLDILVKALAEASASGERVFLPEGPKDDSLSFRLSFESPGVREGGKLEQLRVRVANPVFTLPMPWFRPGEMTKKPRIDYPIRPQSSNYQGKVVLEFVVDNVGHIVPASVHEVLSPGVQRPVGEEAGIYRNLVAATIRSAPSGEYKPATIAGCPINHTVRQSFDFKLDQ
jgi:hypothetical protein